MLYELQQERQRRELQLEQSLSLMGCEVPASSRLCAAYLSGERLCVQCVATAVREQAFFHEHTRYKRWYRCLTRRASLTGVTRTQVAHRAKQLAWAEYASSCKGDGALDQAPLCVRRKFAHATPLPVV